MSETSSVSDMSEEQELEHSSLLDFVLEASGANQNFAAANVAEIMDNFVCPPGGPTVPTYTHLNDYCNFNANTSCTASYGYDSMDLSPSSHGMFAGGNSPNSTSSAEWEHTSYDLTDLWTQQNTSNFSQHIDCTNNSDYSPVSSNFPETNQHFQVRDVVGLPKLSTQQHHVVHRRQRSSDSSPNKAPKRRRVTTVTQRKAANVRERRRMFNLNEAFDILRKRVPAFSYEKQLSRIDTLRLAVTYIGFMQDILKGKRVDQVKLLQLQSQFAELKAANALPSASRPKPKNSASNGSGKSSRANSRGRRKNENIINFNTHIKEQFFNF